MSHFYGTLQGARGHTTRCGDKRSGMVTEAAGWHGAIRVTLERNEADGVDMFRVELIPWGGQQGTPRTLAFGRLDINCLAGWSEAGGWTAIEVAPKAEAA